MWTERISLAPLFTFVALTCSATNTVSAQKTDLPEAQPVPQVPQDPKTQTDSELSPELSPFDDLKKMVEEAGDRKYGAPQPHKTDAADQSAARAVFQRQKITLENSPHISQRLHALGLLVAAISSDDLSWADKATGITTLVRVLRNERNGTLKREAALSLIMVGNHLVDILLNAKSRAEAIVATDSAQRLSAIVGKTGADHLLEIAKIRLDAAEESLSRAGADQREVRLGNVLSQKRVVLQAEIEIKRFELAVRNAEESLAKSRAKLSHIVGESKPAARAQLTRITIELSDIVANGVVASDALAQNAVARAVVAFLQTKQIDISTETTAEDPVTDEPEEGMTTLTRNPGVTERVAGVTIRDSPARVGEENRATNVAKKTSLRRGTGRRLHRAGVPVDGITDENLDPEQRATGATGAPIRRIIVTPVDPINTPE